MTEQITSEGWREALCFIPVNEEPPISMELQYYEILILRQGHDQT